MKKSAYFFVPLFDESDYIRTSIFDNFFTLLNIFGFFLFFCLSRMRCIILRFLQQVSKLRLENTTN